MQACNSEHCRIQRKQSRCSKPILLISLLQLFLWY
jgi:hypothetical protein